MDRIFEILRKKSNDDTYYLKSLNFIQDVDMEIYRSLDSEFDNGYFEKLLQEDNWRFHLVTYTYVMAASKNEHINSLKERLMKGSFVSPQIAVAIALLSGGRTETGDFFVTLLNDPDATSKTKGATIAVLPLCRIQTVVLDRQELDPHEFCIGYSIANKHVMFWKDFNRGENIAKNYDLV